MTTNLKSIAGTDFDDLFEAGAGNQLLNIYAMDGQDVGQKYLNVSQGSQVSANTGFQASDSADVKTKLCGKGTIKGDFAITVGTWNYVTGYAAAGTFSGQSQQCGAISARPYWNVAGYSWRLTSLIVSTHSGALVTGDTYEGYRKVTSAPSTLSVRFSCNGGTATTPHPGSWGVWMYYTSDVFGLRNAVGKTLQVFCNPKPDGYV